MSSDTNFLNLQGRLGKTLIWKLGEPVKFSKVSKVFDFTNVHGSIVWFRISPVYKFKPDYNCPAYHATMTFLPLTTISYCMLSYNMKFLKYYPLTVLLCTEQYWPGTLILLFLFTENENDTMCTSPDNLKNRTITTVSFTNCEKTDKIRVTTIPPIPTNSTNNSQMSAFNDTRAKSLDSGMFQFRNTRRGHICDFRCCIFWE